MRQAVTIAALAVAALLLCGCGEQSNDAGKAGAEAVPATAAQSPAPSEAAPEPRVVTIRAVGKTFEGPTEIPSGWITFRLVNASDMVHFAMIDVPPEGVTAQRMSDEVGEPFQEMMNAMNAGDDAAVQAAAARFPAWLGELGRHGGPGLTAPGLMTESTVFMTPGAYILECYVKTDGVFHSTSPGDGKLGMLHAFNVTGEEAKAPEPSANVTLEIRNSGFRIADGALRKGRNTIRVDFVEQQALPSFVGNDVHLMKVEAPDSIGRASAWMDWRKKDGLQTPAPVTFLGGMNDMPQGSHGYVSVDLEPGDYAFIAEVPDPQAMGLVLPFSIGAE